MYDFRVVKLDNYQEFINLTQEFDIEVGTKTGIMISSLSEINNKFFKRNIQESLNEIIQSVFAYRNKILSTTTEIDPDFISKIYSFYHIVRDLQNGRGLLHPLNLHYFGNRRVGLHPGNTRLNFAEQYSKPIHLIITCYQNANIELLELTDTDFDVTDLTFFTNRATKKDGPRSIYRNAKRETYYKECKDMSTMHWGWNCINEDPLEFALYNNTVYVGEEKIIEKLNNKWRFCI